ncbi:zinc finger protein 438 isoform X1 [Ornithorhynchus anatinus]|uniref:Zinc finger protein 438 n=1 Tax=Ornithorhynchus anatinus TaxID=9258 RepID=F6PQ31_ORNAN|nr:zinc finger protein 438 isoform X1 [Ornithorhynchus anatinus]XP_007665980.1 zinc finger protein 438 isoform X1 [Ornithorhynchus anatinus]XP_007665981.1 zinc finger protein 438 isoform X1 [Ornithorhynchus anatinus]XP_007665982.1 zinc finger protein 438 isoform X1 [Ornithorhynchus anatinus]XP_007665983.1 zinc finger protein 438 isoform X1 [Ornithorhynchus anatinus]XP_007665984.1 zinc finger protein 438 isoform X1 [Ornithorhynchus anatinus]XP_028933392.1 zinc finger protein 438 isoform X1 [Or
MQNPLLVSPKDQGGVFVESNPTEKQRGQHPLLAQPTQETCIGKTVSTDDLKFSPGTIKSGKSWQSKSQFRTIAPKIAPKVITSRVLSCHPTSVPEKANPVPTAHPKPLVMPPQNYALMQVAGQEGTFSLVALPQVTPALTTQPIQKPNMLPENPKLPIPRYQPTRNKKPAERKAVQNSSPSPCCKTPTKVQAAPATTSLPNPGSSIESSEQVVVIDQGPTEIPVAPLLGASRQAVAGPPLKNRPETANAAPLVTSSGPKEDSAKPDQENDLVKGNTDAGKPAIKPPAGKGEALREKAIESTKAVTVLSPAIFGNAVQLIPPAPKGKLPILPYARMKTSLFCKPKQSPILEGTAPSPWRGSDRDPAPPLLKGLNVSEKLLASSVAQASSQMGHESALGLAVKEEANLKKKSSGGTANRIGKKRKAPEEILTFPTKRRKSTTNKCREGKERVKLEAQEPRDRKPGTVKRYRSIMPKPIIVVPSLAPLSSPAAILQAQSPKRDALVDTLLSNKHFGSKPNEGPPARSGAGYRNLSSAPQRPWHRCHVCNHNFQFKHHLQDHMNTHTNRRPHSCRMCRKAYVHSGSLSTHMKLHHGESRLKRLVCCEFCAKVFGHIKVYFGHLKEVHRVVISTEASFSESQHGDTSKTRDMGVKGTQDSTGRENRSSLEEDLFPNQAEEVKLQIKCGRCQITTQSFAEMKFHLLCVHGEEIQGRLAEGVPAGCPGTQEELVKHAAQYWKERQERRSLPKRGPPEEGSASTGPKLKRQIYPQQQQQNLDLPTNPGGHPSRTGEPAGVPQNLSNGTPNKIQVWSSSGLHCLLCKQILGSQEELFLHWQQQHNCENPSTLWTILNAFSTQGVTELAKNPENGKAENSDQRQFCSSSTPQP